MIPKESRHIADCLGSRVGHVEEVESVGSSRAEMRVRVDEPRCDRKSMKIDAPGSRPDEFRNRRIVAHGDDPVPADRHRLGNMVTRIHREDRAVKEDEIRRRLRSHGCHCGRLEPGGAPEIVRPVQHTVLHDEPHVLKIPDVLEGVLVQDNEVSALPHLDGPERPVEPHHFRGHGGGGTQRLHGRNPGGDVELHLTIDAQPGYALVRARHERHAGSMQRMEGAECSPHARVRRGGVHRGDAHGVHALRKNGGQVDDTGNEGGDWFRRRVLQQLSPRGSGIHHGAMPAKRGDLCLHAVR